MNGAPKKKREGTLTPRGEKHFFDKKGGEPISVDGPIRLQSDLYNLRYLEGNFFFFFLFWKGPTPNTVRFGQLPRLSIKSSDQGRGSDVYCEIKSAGSS